MEQESKISWGAPCGSSSLLGNFGASGHVLGCGEGQGLLLEAMAPNSGYPGVPAAPPVSP